MKKMPSLDSPFLVFVDLPLNDHSSGNGQLADFMVA